MTRESRSITCATDIGRATHPEVHKVVILALNRSAAGSIVRPRLELLRSLGVPEPVILDYLAKDLHHKINGNGAAPRTERGSCLGRADLAQLSAASGPEAGLRRDPGTHTSDAGRTPRLPHSLFKGFSMHLRVPVVPWD